MGTAEVQGLLWGQAAQDWATLSEPKHEPLWKAMLNEAPVSSGKRFLDAGCGGGGASVLAAKRDARISGIDASDELIAIASERVPGGDFRVGDIEFLPYEDNAFDVVFAANTVQYSANRLATLRGFARVCRPEGRIVAGLFGPPATFTFRAMIDATIDALPEPPPGAGPFELSTPGKLESLFEEAGLTVLRSGEVDCPFHYPDLEIFWRAMVASGPTQGAMRVIGGEKLKAALCEAAEPFRLDDGSIRIQPNMFRYVVATL